MGIVKIFPNQGGTPPPPIYQNYVGVISGSYANQQGLDGTLGEIYVPLNNASFLDSPTNDKNVTNMSLSASGQDVDFYFYGVNVCLGNIGRAGGDGNPYDFTINVYIDGALSYTETASRTDFGTIAIVLPSPVAVTSKIQIGIVTTCDYFDLVNCNTLFYCTGNIIPPPACEYFGLVSATTVSGLTVTSTLAGTGYITPLTYSCNWYKTAGSYISRVRNWKQISSDPTATLITGQTYYVELTLSQAMPVTGSGQQAIRLWFGGLITDVQSNAGFSHEFDGTITTPQGILLEWNPNNRIGDILFGFNLKYGTSLANAYTGTISWKVGTSYCP